MKCLSNDCQFPSCICAPQISVHVSKHGNETKTKIEVRGVENIAEAMALARLAKEALDAEIADADKCPVHIAEAARFVKPT